MRLPQLLIAIFFTFSTTNIIAQKLYDENESFENVSLGVYYQHGPGTNNTLNWKYQYGTKLTVNAGIFRNFEITSIDKFNSGYAVRQFNQNTGLWTGWRNFLIDDGNGNAKVDGIIDVKGVDITGITRRLDSGWAETDFNWVGHSLVFGTKPGAYAHNVIEIKPGGSSRGALQSDLKMYHATSEMDRDQRVNISTSTSASTYFNAGNVGIGTTAPNSKLHVNGEIRSEKGFIISGNSRFTEKGNNLHIWSIADMEFGTGGETSKMVLDTNGNLGIGTTTPKNKLSVNGTMWAKKVIIQLTDAADWVFEEDYNLRPLSEVAAFIKANKHLPEIPSAEEFRTNDMEVSEMTNKLLQKIEELMLYTIAQEEKLVGQQTKLNIQEIKLGKQAVVNEELNTRLAKLEALLVK